MGARRWLAASCSLALVACAAGQVADGGLSDAAAEPLEAGGSVDGSVGTPDAHDATESAAEDDDAKEAPDAPDATHPVEDAGTEAEDAGMHIETSSGDARDAAADDGSMDAGDASADALADATQPVIVRLTITPAVAEVAIGCGPQQLRATATYSDGTSMDVTSASQWTADPPEVVSIDAHGRSTCLTAGTADVQALYAGVEGLALAVCTAGVIVSVEVFPAATSLPPGNAIQYTALAIDSASQRCDVTPNALWQSSALAVAAISDAGLAIALAEGRTVIGASLYGITGEAGLTVTSDAGSTSVVGDAGPDSGPDAAPDADASNPACTAPDAAVIAVFPESATIAVGTLVQFIATGYPGSDGLVCDATADVLWQSSSPSVAAIVTEGPSSGLVRGLSVGTTSVTASIGDVTDTAVLAVE